MSDTVNSRGDVCAVGNLYVKVDNEVAVVG